MVHTLPRYGVNGALLLCSSRCALGRSWPLLYNIWRSCIIITGGSQCTGWSPAYLRPCWAERGSIRRALSFLTVSLGSCCAAAARPVKCALDRILHMCMGNLKPPCLTHEGEVLACTCHCWVRVVIFISQ